MRGGRSGRGRGGRGSEIRGRSSEIEGRGGGDPGQRGRGRGRDGRRYLVARRSIADTRAPLPSIPVDVDVDDEEDDIPPAAFTRSPPSLLNNLNLFVDVAMGMSDDPVTVSPGSLSGGGGNGGDITDGAPGPEDTNFREDADPTKSVALRSVDANANASASENMTEDTAPGLGGIENAVFRPGGDNASESTTVGAATEQGGHIMLPKFFDNSEGERLACYLLRESKAAEGGWGATMIRNAGVYLQSLVDGGLFDAGGEFYRYVLIIIYIYMCTFNLYLVYSIQV